LSADGLSEAVWGQVTPSELGNRVDDSQVEIFLRNELAGQAKVSGKLLRRHRQAFILRRRPYLARFNLDQAETTRPVATATGTNQKTGGLQDLQHGRAWRKGDLPSGFAGHDGELRHAIAPRGSMRLPAQRRSPGWLRAEFRSLKRE
jgi:hypothetical protein